MAHAGSVKPTVEMQIMDGTLVLGKREQRVGAVSDVAEAVRRLMAGEVVYVHGLASVVAAVERAVQQAMMEG